MADRPATGVLVVRTVPGQAGQWARVTATHDITRREERFVVVESLPMLLAEVERWWRVSWLERVEHPHD